MDKTVKLPLLALAAMASLAAPASAREKLTGEQELAQMLEGRVAGEARSCLTGFQQRNMQIVDGTAIVFRQGKTLWVNVPRNADQLDDDDVLVTRQFGSQLCRLDNVQTYDRHGFFFNGVVFLGDFIPYRRVD